MNLKQILQLVLVFSFPMLVKAQELNPFHQNLANQVSSQNILNNLTDFVGFGIKETGTAAQANALQWLVSKYQSWGYTQIDQQSVNVFGEIGYNLIVTKTGTVYPDTYIILDGHYDTINGVGANDNGSGTAVILEAARVLQNIPTEYSIKFIHFTGEELGLIGSEHYVEDIAIPQGLDIKLVLNIDQVGGVGGEVNDQITCERDESWPNPNNNQSAIVTNQLSVLMELYSGLDTQISFAYGSDYVPFQEAGYVITGLYESNESPYTHSPYDTMDNMDPDFVFEVAKGTLGAMCFFAKAYENMAVDDLGSIKTDIYPNPVTKFLNIRQSENSLLHFKLVNFSGEVLLTGGFSGKNTDLDLSTIPNGVYLLNLIGENGNQTHKVIVNHP